MSKEKDAKIGSDLDYLDALRDEDIDYEDAPVPDLADFVRDAVPFHETLAQRLQFPEGEGREN